MFKRYVWLVLIFAVPSDARDMLRDRTVQRQSKQQLDTLLTEIGASNVDEASKKIKGLPQMLDSLHVSSIEEASTVVASTRDAKERIASMQSENIGLRKQVKDLENRYQDLITRCQKAGQKMDKVRVMLFD